MTKSIIFLFTVIFLLSGCSISTINQSINDTIDKIGDSLTGKRTEKLLQDSSKKEYKKIEIDLSQKGQIVDLSSRNTLKPLNHFKSKSREYRFEDNLIFKDKYIVNFHGKTKEADKILENRKYVIADFGNQLFIDNKSLNEQQMIQKKSNNYNMLYDLFLFHLPNNNIKVINLTTGQELITRKRYLVKKSFIAFNKILSKNINEIILRVAQIDYIDQESFNTILNYHIGNFTGVSDFNDYCIYHTNKSVNIKTIKEHTFCKKAFNRLVLNFNKNDIYFEMYEKSL